MKELKFTIECDDYRTLRIPSTAEKSLKLGTLFTEISKLPEELKNWVEVNPRDPKFNKAGNLSGAVSRSIVKTLEEKPSVFSLKNLGIYILVDKVEAKRIAGDKHVIEITLSNKKKHGIVNGGHTFTAIRQVLNAKECLYDGGAFVRLHLYMNVSEGDIVELADGLNTNLQVTETSLANLSGEFDLIINAMKGKKGSSEIAYSDGSLGKIDVLDVLHILSCFDFSNYPGDKKHPNDIFGNKKKILGRYVRDIEEENSSYKILIKHIFEILVLSEEIQKAFAPQVSNFKIKNTEKNNRVGSEIHKKPAIFTEGIVGGYIPQGWLYPIISAFRANIKPSAWKEGKIDWLVPNEELLNGIIKDLSDKIINQHLENKNKPGEVGRKATAYELCYSVAFMYIAKQGKLEF